MTRRLLDGLFTALAMLLFIPTTLILISWNAIPGDGLYPLKTGLEDVTLLVLSGTPLVPKVSLKFTDRRFNEATTLLAKKGSTVGYSLLVAEASQTRTLIASKNDKVTSATFVQNIDTYQKQIEAKKAEIQAGGTKSTSPVFTPRPTAMPVPTLAPTSNFGSPTPKPIEQQVVVVSTQTIVIQQETNQQILDNLNNTEQQLEQIKQEVQSDQHGNGNNENNGNHGNNNSNGNNGNNSGGSHGNSNDQNH